MQLHEKSLGFLQILQITPQKYMGQGGWVIFVCLRRAGRGEAKGRRRKEGSCLAAGWLLHQPTLLLGNS